MTRRRPWLPALLLAATVVAVLAALLLTGSDDEVDVDALMAAVPRAVDEQRTAQLETTVKIGSESSGLSVDGTGAVDFTTGAGWFDVDALDDAIQLRTDGATLFVRRPDDTAWLAMHLEHADALGAFGTGMTAATAFVDLLRSSDGEVEDLGIETIGGERTRHLRVDVDLDRAAAAVLDGAGPAMEALSRLAPGGALPLEVWIDERNLPVRQRMRGGTPGLELLVTVDLTQWGEELGVQIPPEGAVRDVEPEELSQILGRAPGG